MSDRAVEIGIPGPALVYSRDPSLMIEPGEENGPDRTSGFRAFKNMLFDGRSLRTAYGLETILANKVYAGGTTAKVAIVARADATLFFGNILVAIRQLRVTGTASATSSGYLVDATLNQFTPEHVGRIVYDATGGSYTVVTGYINQYTLEVADDIFASGDSYWIAVRSQIVGMAPYVVDGFASLADGTVLGEMEDDERFEIITFQNRAYILSGTNRGGIVYKNSFRNIGLTECTDNNTLGVDVSNAGDLSGNYRWALVWYDPDTYKKSAPLVIENGGDWYTVANKRLVINLATLPTSATDTYTHLELFRKRDEWDDWYRVATISKDAATGSGTTTSAAARELHDTGASFSVDDVGMTVRLALTGQTARITKCLSASQVALDADIFRGGEAYVLCDGTTTSAAAFKLIDSNATFTSSIVGKKVHDAANNYAIVTALDSPTQLSIDTDIFGSGEAYTICPVTTMAQTNRLVDSGAVFSAADVGKRVHNGSGVWATVIAYVNSYTLDLDADLFPVSGRAYRFEDGRMTSAQTDKLIDVRASFTAGQVGDSLYDESNTHTTISAVDDENTLSLADDLFPTFTGQSWASEFGDNVLDAIALASDVLIPDRDPPCGFTKMFTWRNRPHWYGGYRLEIPSGVSVSNGAATVTLAGYTTDEWMIGSTIYLSAVGASSVNPYEIRRILSSTQLELVSEFTGTTISGGRAVIITNPNRIVFGYQTFGDAEMANVYYQMDVEPDDGDLLMYCGVVETRLICLKRRAVYLLAVSEVVDEPGNDVPQVNYRALSLGCREGCVGPDAACIAERRLWWFAGENGILMYDGSKIQDVSAPVRDWFRRMDSNEFYHARLFFEPVNKELMLTGLQLADGSETHLGVAMSLMTGQWRELVDLDVSAQCIVRVKS